MQVAYLLSPHECIERFRVVPGTATLPKEPLVEVEKKLRLVVVVSLRAKKETEPLEHSCDHASP